MTVIQNQKKIKTRENVRIEVYDNGKLVDERQGSNLIMDLGIAMMASRLVAATYNPVSHIAIGTGDTAPTAADTTLETEVDREAATITFITTDTTNDTVQLVYIFDISGNKTLAEAGLFNDASAGEIFARHTFSALPVLDGWQVKVIWRFDFDQRSPE